jgi:hypothetical protein
LLILADGQGNAIKLEALLVRCAGATLLLGTQKRTHASLSQAEILKLSNDSCLMTCEAARINRELQQAQ